MSFLAGFPNAVLRTLALSPDHPPKGRHNVRHQPSISAFKFQPFIGWGGLATSRNGDVGGSDPTGLVLAVGGGYDVFAATAGASVAWHATPERTSAQLIEGS
jgi:hypothetical protein